MAELNTIARPYAYAAFDCALHQQQLELWQDILDLLAAYVVAEPISMLLLHPSIHPEELGELLIELAAKGHAGAISTELENFVRLLAQNRRLAVLPMMADLFRQRCAEHNQSMTAEVYSTVPLNEEQQQSMAAALSKRFNCQVELHYYIDDSLIGGALIKAGDKVIDGSIKGKLSRLMNNITGRELCN